MFDSSESKSCPRKLVAMVFLWALSCGPCHSADVILQNDTIPPGIALAQFISGERVASWITIPTTGNLVGVQIAWGSMFGGAPATTETAITISSGGIFPTPGASLGVISTPTLTDMAAVNEFRHLDPPTNNNPIQIPVTAGQVVVVDLQFFNQNAGNVFAPSIEYDGDGIQTGINSVFSIPGGWADAALLGVTGDFGIRAILDPIPEPSAALLCLLGLGAMSARRRKKRAIGVDHL